MFNEIGTLPVAIMPLCLIELETFMLMEYADQMTPCAGDNSWFIYIKVCYTLNQLFKDI